MSEEQIDLFQVKMTSNEPVVKPPKALPDSTTSFVRDKDDPRLKQATEVNTLEDIETMLHEIEGNCVLAQACLRALINKNNNTGTYADALSLKDSLGAEIPF